MTRPLSRRSVLGLLAAAPLAGAAAVPMAGEAAVARSAARARSAAPPADLRPGGAYDRLLRQLAAEDKFSGTVLLASKGRPVLARSYGMANKDRSIPNGPDTLFNLASITKTFTAVAIAQLAQQGKVGFHETLRTYLDGFPAEVADTVTVHHLLTHTSGIGRPALGPGPPDGLDWQSFDEVMDGTLAIIRRQTRPHFTPGTQFEYSNDAFFVLGAIVARVSEQSYFDFVRRHIFRPAGMTRTDFYSRPRVLAASDIAHPYATQVDGTRFDFSASEFFPFTNGPAGGAYSTSSELLRFAQAISAGTLLRPAFAELITGGKVALPPEAAPPEPPSQTLFYGYGYLDAIVNSQRVLGHSGNSAGVATRLDVFPDLGWASVILSNYDTTINPLVERERELITG
jgi:CubicO group peptidase (beta-lactamase class C family)